jgi:hypothetical protein
MISRMIGYREGGMVGIGAPACARSPHLYHPHKIGIKGRQARHNTAYKMVAVASWYEYPYPPPSQDSQVRQNLVRLPAQKVHTLVWPRNSLKCN